jgi:hypothetical protein
LPLVFYPPWYIVDGFHWRRLSSMVIFHDGSQVVAYECLYVLGSLILKILILVKVVHFKYVFLTTSSTVLAGLIGVAVLAAKILLKFVAAAIVVPSTPISFIIRA